MDKLKERLESYKKNLEIVTDAVRKAKEQLAAVEKMQAQLEALVAEFTAVIGENDNASSSEAGPSNEGGSESPSGSVDVAEELPTVVS